MYVCMLTFLSTVPVFFYFTFSSSDFTRTLAITSVSKGTKDNPAGRGTQELHSLLKSRALSTGEGMASDIGATKFT